ncbi:MAG: WecB/TagA/CpsF family glycosyltransferase [Peptostreptococcaceae bacterium]
MNVKILDLDFFAGTKNELLENIYSRVKSNKKTFIITANAEIAMYARENNNYLEISKRADIIIPDGIGIVKGAQIKKKSIKERIPGIELTMDLLSHANDNNEKVYFYGAKEETIQTMVLVLKEKFSKLDICGYHNGYHDDSDNKIVNEIIELKPDYIFVAKGCPLQDEWIIKALDRVDKGLFMGVGGSFDVISGNTKRAPKIWQKLNIEWLYRVLNDPKRIGRYISLPKFVLEVIKDKEE